MNNYPHNKMTENMRTGETFGGNDVDLPSSLTITKFSAARSREIEILEKALSSSSAVKLAFQKLPKHMRRRAMSHNVKRLPRRLREIHLNQMKKSGLPPKQKRPSRKYRRRPNNLTSDYVRRQRGVTWLNTHIWHAKRFHMVQKWGFRLPFSPCDRSFRACYRATMEHCLLQDISYYSCVEISGLSDDIVNGIKKVTRPSNGLSVAAKPYVNGLREGQITLFHTESEKAIGIINFHWRPTNNTTEKRQLWLWIHAAYYKESLDTLISCFNLQQVNNTNQSAYTSRTVEMRILKWELSRFRLTGPLSTAILQNAFKLANINEKNSDWFCQFIHDVVEVIPSPNDKWKSLNNNMSPSVLTPHTILPLNIQDPRFNFPKRRTKALPFQSSSNNDVIEDIEYDSPLWSDEIRSKVEQSKISSAQIAELRRNLLVPGSDLEEPGVPVPIILVQRPGKRGSDFIGYGSGWDILLPSAWAQPIWLSLIMWGARTGGLKETDSIDFESSHQYLLYPDTASGKEEENHISEKCMEKFFKLSPNKRTNYTKFCISSPFKWNWKLLLNEWSSESEVTEFCVLRDKAKLRLIQRNLTNSKAIQNLEICEKCLIPVTINLAKKGHCSQFALICLPLESDMKNEPTEPVSQDSNERLRKELRRKHKSLLKTLRKRRIRAKTKGKIIPIDKEMLRNYSAEIRKLWIPETTLLRHSCSREVMGMVKHGDFSLLSGKSKAIGYITVGALSKLMASRDRTKVLVRNTNSRQYRIGTLNIICD